MMGPDRQRYELVGGCFVEGIMNGENMETYEPEAATVTLV
jgi:hypothetical protein